MLVGIVTTKADRDLFHSEGWYRVPQEHWPHKDPNWKPSWVAIFESVQASEGQQCIRYYGRVKEIRSRTGAELFPGVPRGGREHRKYWQIVVDEALERSEPILFHRNRRNPFILSTLERFERARSASELMVGSHLEELLWDRLRGEQIPVEREWPVDVGGKRYWLDFALFCRERDIDVEVDGDSYHIKPERAAYDNERNNRLTSEGWGVLRFSTAEIEHGMSQVMARIRATINAARGLRSDGDIPRWFPPGSQAAQQLSMLEEQAPYDEAYEVTNWDCSAQTDPTEPEGKR